LRLGRWYLCGAPGSLFAVALVSKLESRRT